MYVQIKSFLKFTISLLILQVTLRLRIFSSPTSDWRPYLFVSSRTQLIQFFLGFSLRLLPSGPSSTPLVSLPPSTLLRWLYHLNSLIPVFSVTESSTPIMWLYYSLFFQIKNRLLFAPRSSIFVSITASFDATYLYSCSCFVWIIVTTVVL